jgi:hypothetical protein
LQAELPGLSRGFGQDSGPQVGLEEKNRVKDDFFLAMAKQGA